MNGFYLPPPARNSEPTLPLAFPKRPRRWSLNVQTKEDSFWVPLREVRMVLGASDAADIVVRDDTVSALHCAITPGPHGVYVEDLGSTNGIYIASARVSQAYADVGTCFLIGRTAVTVTGEAYEGARALGPPLPGVVGKSPVMLQLARQVRRLASLSTPVLICGESGTGKELIAKALHELGPRERQPFVVLNMGAMPKDLIESEFFGHEKGAFTGAIRKKKGAFFEAEGGTLFLDEIGELPLEGQSKLLRALDGYAVRAVGASGTGVKANVRIVAATHVDLEDRVKEGRFRHDLFYRLGVFVVNVPPLRERQEDILPIAHSILSKARELGRKELSPSAMARLMAHKWPGNVRELRNVLYRAAERTQGTGVIHCIDVDRFLRDFDTKDSRVQAAPDLARAILRDCEDNVSAAARVFGIPRTSFRRLLLRS